MTDSRPPGRPVRDREQWAELVQRCPLFQGIGLEALRQLLESARQHTAPRGGFFFLEGGSPRRVYLLIRGKVRMVRSGPQGREIVLGFIEPGEPFGFVAVWAETVHGVSAQAAQASQAIAWDVPIIAQLMTRHPEIALSGLRLMARHVEGSWDRLQDLSTGRVEWRIARALIRLARLTERTIDAGAAITVDVREQDLAELTGSTAFTVSRILSAWRRTGIVDVHRERVLLRKPRVLLTMTEDMTGTTS